MSIINQFLPKKTAWKFSTSQSMGACVGSTVSLCGSGGSYFVIDPAGQEHPLNYVSVEVGVALAVPQPWTIFGALKSFPSGGVGYIYQGPSVKSGLALDDLKSGMTAIITLSKGTMGASADMSLIFLGVPYPGAIDPSSLLRSKAAGLMWGVIARAEISLFGISAGVGKIL